MTFKQRTYTERLQLFTDLIPDADQYIDRLRGMGFFTAPASRKYHGAYPGGLFDHSYAVAKHLLKLTEDNHLTWDDPRSPALVGIFHDLCKCDQYRGGGEDIYDADSGTMQPDFTWRKDQLLKGHGDKSVMLLCQFTSLTEEEVLCIRYHMGAFTDKEDWNDYTRAVALYPNVLWTHQADMLASHVDGI